MHDKNSIQPREFVLGINGSREVDSKGKQGKTTVYYVTKMLSHSLYHKTSMVYGPSILYSVVSFFLKHTESLLGFLFPVHVHTTVATQGAQKVIDRLATFYHQTFKTQ